MSNVKKHAQILENLDKTHNKEIQIDHRLRKQMFTADCASIGGQGILAKRAKRSFEKYDSNQ